MAQSSQVLQTASEGGSKEEKTIFDFFGKKEPAHVGAGVGMGLRSIAKGVFAGAAGLVLQPLAGAGKGGVLGFSKGALLGENCSLRKAPIQTKPSLSNNIAKFYSTLCSLHWLLAEAQKGVVLGCQKASLQDKDFSHCLLRTRANAFKESWLVLRGCIFS